MKIWDIKLNEKNVGKKYKCSANDQIYKIEKATENHYDLVNEYDDSVTAELFLSELVEAEFEEVVDWSKVLAI